jgi:hypothetical protein
VFSFSGLLLDCEWWWWWCDEMQQALRSLLQISAIIFSGAVPVHSVLGLGVVGVSFSLPSFSDCYLWGFGVLLLNFVLGLILGFCCKFFINSVVLVVAGRCGFRWFLCGGLWLLVHCSPEFRRPLFPVRVMVMVPPSFLCWLGWISAALQRRF